MFKGMERFIRFLQDRMVQSEGNGVEGEGTSQNIQEDVEGTSQNIQEDVEDEDSNANSSTTAIDIPNSSTSTTEQKASSSSSCATSGGEEEEQGEDEDVNKKDEDIEDEKEFEDVDNENDEPPQEPPPLLFPEVDLSGEDVNLDLDIRDSDSMDSTSTQDNNDSGGVTTPTTEITEIIDERTANFLHKLKQHVDTNYQSEEVWKDLVGEGTSLEKSLDQFLLNSVAEDIGLSFSQSQLLVGMKVSGNGRGDWEILEQFFKQANN